MKKILGYQYFLLLLIIWISASNSNQICVSNQTVSFVNQFLNIHGNGSQISKQTLEKIFTDFTGQKNFYDECQKSVDKSCAINKCLSMDDILHLHGYVGTSAISHQGLVDISPALLHNHKKCQPFMKGDHESSEVFRHKKPSVTASWGFGFLFVTIINICSLAGAVVLPFMKKKFYVKILIFMVALAVGSLAGSGLLVLIPEAFGFLQDPAGNHDYLWKALTVGGGVYLFFLIERILKIVLQVRKRKPARAHYSDAQTDSNEFDKPFLPEREKDADGSDTYVVHNKSSGATIKTQTPTTDRQKYSDTSTLPTDSLKHSTESRQELKASFFQGSQDTLCTLSKEKDSKVENGSSSSEDEPVIIQQERGEVKTIAWMIIFGDGLHNFLDGLSIGAAFTDSIFAGMSISLAVICEELPHELGDFAILLNSGMTVKKALMYNFLSACMCYLGLVLGLIVGANTTAHTWIFAIAGGMFLYISLVDMMPEMNSAAENEEYRKMFGTTWIFVVQNVGMLFGFGVIFIMALYGSQINIGD